MKNSRERYLLLDTSDVGNALSPVEIRCLLWLEQKIAEYRQKNDKPQLQYGVVDIDWQNHQQNGQAVVESVVDTDRKSQPLKIEASGGLLTITTGITPMIDSFTCSYSALDLGVSIRDDFAFARDVAEVMSQAIPHMGPHFYTVTNEAALEAISQGSVHATVSPTTKYQIERNGATRNE